MHALEALRRSPILGGLSEATLARVAHVALRRVCAAGDIILLQGEPCEAAYLIVEGHVRVYRLSPGGREQVLARLGPGQAFNTAAPFLRNGRNHATVQAITHAVLVAIPHGDFVRLVGDCPELATALLSDFAARLDHLTNLVEDLALRSVRGRLARFLLEQAVEGEVSRRWTLDEMASHLGTVRDMIGRTLRSFADAEMIRLDRRRIELVDRQALEDEALA
jgi:CRP/FNR family cyclic AMP-dependent transcriptional regulator